MDMPAQDADAQRMERRYVRFGFPFSADQFADPLLHFVGGFVGEGHCQDALRFDTEDDTSCERGALPFLPRGTLVPFSAPSFRPSGGRGRRDNRGG